MRDLKQHWESIYANKKDEEVSWYQEYPAVSLSIIEKYGRADRKDKIIDVGGGTSRLVQELVKRSYTDLSVLDISRSAIERNRKIIPNANVNWIAGDLLAHEFRVKFDIWHDRAVFHFLTVEKDITNYIRIASDAIAGNGYLILGTFSETGPVKCSGLPVTQYSEFKFRMRFESAFELREFFEEAHYTPSGTRQNFIWGVFRRR